MPPLIHAADEGKYFGHQVEKLSRDLITQLQPGEELKQTSVLPDGDTVGPRNGQDLLCELPPSLGDYPGSLISGGLAAKGQGLFRPWPGGAHFHKLCQKVEEPTGGQIPFLNALPEEGARVRKE